MTLYPREMPTMRFAALALLPLIALAGCGGGADNASAPVQSSTPVAAATAPAGQKWVDVVAKTDKGYVQGNPNAPIKPYRRAFRRSRSGSIGNNR